MTWEGKPLRSLREADIRGLINTGLEEHLQLEYKSALYEDSDRGRRELLLDVCMFANAIGGLILIGVPERRDAGGQPTGAPDPEAVLGLDIANAEVVLASYDARVMEAIEERLPLESASIDVGNERRVLAIRVPNSANKPHSVRCQGHVYFPSRRERQRYSLSVREIKELVMRAASRMQRAEELLETSFSDVVRDANCSYLMAGLIPVFFDDYLVDVTLDGVRREISNFSRGPDPEWGNSIFTFDGIERHDNRFDHTVRFHRNGLLNTSQQLPVRPLGEGHNLRDLLRPVAVDMLLRNFVTKAVTVYVAAAVGPPYILGLKLDPARPVVGGYAGFRGFEEQTAPIEAKEYSFPFVHLDNFSSVDQIIRPLCDQAHQMFGRERSPKFTAEGNWIPDNM